MRRLLTATTVPGTVRAFLMPFAAHYRARGWKVDVMAADASRCPVLRQGFSSTWDMPWSRSPLDPSNLRRTPHLIRSVVNGAQYEIVHVHTPIAAFVTRFALRKSRLESRTKVVYTAHGFHFHSSGTPVKNAAYRTLERIAGRWTDHLVVMNKEDYDAAISMRLVPPQAVTFMPGIGVDTSEYDPASVEPSHVVTVREKEGIPSSAPLFLMVAEFIPRKRHVDALHALAKIGRSDVNLMLAGDGPLTTKMKDLAAALNIASRVHFLGRRNDIRILMRASSAVVLPSTHEGLPRSIMEALSMGVPVIGSDIRGTNDLLERGAGVLFPVGDVNGLADAMQWIVDNPAEGRVMGQRGRAQMIAECDTSHILRAHDDLYNKILSQ